MKNVISVILIFALAFGGLGGVFLTADAATHSINIMYIGQPTETTGKWADYALKVKFEVKGYAGTKLRLQLCNSDGIEVVTILSPELKYETTNQPFYLSGKDKNGKVLKDGNYYVNAWIEGSQDDTEWSKYYKLDFKGNDAKTTEKSYVCTHLGQPNNPDSQYYNYALHAKFKVTGYKGKTFKVNLYDEYGDYLQTTTFKITHDTYTANVYYDGTDPDGYWTGDGTYKVIAWIDGEDYSQSWAAEVELKTVSYALGA
jgi:flagellar hook assembly protein FlgD